MPCHQQNLYRAHVVISRHSADPPRSRPIIVVDCQLRNRELPRGWIEVDSSRFFHLHDARKYLRSGVAEQISSPVTIVSLRAAMLPTQSVKLKGLRAGCWRMCRAILPRPTWRMSATTREYRNVSCSPLEAPTRAPKMDG